MRMTMAWVTGSSWTALGLYRVKEQWRSAPVDRMALCWTAHRQEKTGSMVPAPRQGRPLPGQRPKPSRLEHNSSCVDLRTRDAGQCPAEAELCEALASSNGRSAVSFVPVGCDKFGAGQGSAFGCTDESVLAVVINQGEPLGDNQQSQDHHPCHVTAV